MEKNGNKHGAHSKRGRRHLPLAQGKTVFEAEKRLSEKSVIRQNANKEIYFGSCEKTRSHFLKFRRTLCPQYIGVFSMLHVRNWLRHNERYGAIRGGAPAQRHMSLSLHSRLFDFHISSRRFWAFLYNLVPSMRTNKSCFEWLKAGDYYLHQYIVSLSESHIFEEKICYVHIPISEILVTITKQWNIAWVEDCTV